MTAKLAAAGIHLLAETKTHYVFARDNLIALVERREEGFGSIGSTGVATEQGLAYLVWRGGQAFLKSKTSEQAAGDEQVSAVRRFATELKAALECDP